MTIRRIKKKTGRFTLGQSQRSGEVYPLKEFIQDPVTGGWVHPTEADYDTPESRIIHPKKVDISVFPVLPLTEGGGTHHLDNPYLHGRLRLNLVQPVKPRLDYARHLQHPDRYFYMWSILPGESLPTGNQIPETDLQAQSDNILNREREIQFSVDLTDLAGQIAPINGWGLFQRGYFEDRFSFEVENTGVRTGIRLNSGDTYTIDISNSSNGSNATRYTIMADDILGLDSTNTTFFDGSWVSHPSQYMDLGNNILIGWDGDNELVIFSTLGTAGFNYDPGPRRYYKIRNTATTDIVRFVLAFHHSRRHAPATFEIGRPGGIQVHLNANSILERGSDVTLYGEVYHTLITPELVLGSFEGTDRNFYWSI